MFDGQLLFPGAVPATGIKIYGPWMPKGGDHVRITAECLQVDGATLKVELFTKNSEDSGDGTNADSGGVPTNITLNATGRTTTEWYSTGTVTLKEMVRYRFTVTGAIQTDWILFRMLAPVWFNAAKA